MENIFESAEYLNGQSFGHGLSLFSGEGEDDDFTPDSSLSLVVDKTGRVNVSPAGIQLWTGPAEADCIDAGPAVPTFKPGNKFIAGIAAVLPGVPVGGIILFGSGGFTAPPIPAGWGLCDGSAWRVGGAGPLFLTPVLVWSGAAVPIIKYIIKLPLGAVKVSGPVLPIPSPPPN